MCFFADFAIAETVFMRNGQILNGQVLAQDENTVDLKTDHGVLRLEKKDIKRIRFQGSDEKETDEERLANHKRQQQQAIAAEKARLERRAREREIERVKAERKRRDDEAKRKALASVDQASTGLKSAADRAGSESLTVATTNVRERKQSEEKKTQNNSAIDEKKSVEQPTSQFNPSTAMLHSAIIPGSGLIERGRSDLAVDYRWAMGGTGLLSVLTYLKYQDTQTNAIRDRRGAGFFLTLTGSQLAQPLTTALGVYAFTTANEQAVAKTSPVIKDRKRFQISFLAFAGLYLAQMIHSGYVSETKLADSINAPVSVNAYARSFSGREERYAELSWQFRY